MFDHSSGRIMVPSTFLELHLIWVMNMTCRLNGRSIDFIDSQGITKNNMISQELPTIISSYWKLCLCPKCLITLNFSLVLKIYKVLAIQMQVISIQSKRRSSHFFFWNFPFFFSFSFFFTIYIKFQYKWINLQD
jgi:hypothetical protein